jgi:hypothetical protein
MPQYGYSNLDPRYLPSFNDAVAAPAPARSSPLWAGIKSGTIGLGADLANTVGAIGGAAGIQPLQQGGTGIGSWLAQKAEVNGRPDLETAPWHEGGAAVAPWLEYNLGKGLPYLAGLGLAPEAEVPAALAGLPGVTAKTAGMFRAALPFAPGQLYSAAAQKPGGATQEDAIKALALSPVAAAINVAEPGFLHSIGGALEGGFARRMLKGALGAGAVGAVQGGAQTALEQAAFRPDLSPQEKMTNVVDAVATGASVGSVLGGAFGGIRGMKRVDPSALSAQDLGAAIDQVLKPGVVNDQGQLGLPRPGEGSSLSETATKQGEGFTSVNPLEQGPSFDAGQPAPRPFEGRSPEELQAGLGAAAKAIANGTADDVVHRFVEMAHEELAQRAAVNTAVTNSAVSDTAGTVEHSADDKSGVADQGSSAPVPTPTINDTLKGISTRKAYADAKDLDEVKARLLDRLQNGSTAKGDLTLADRLGVDTNAAGKAVETTAARVPEPNDQTALANDSSKTPEPAAPANSGGGDKPVDADFQKKFIMSLGKKEGPAVDELRSNPPANADDAFKRIYDELGKSTADTDPDGYEHLVDLAKQEGVLTKEGQFSDKALELEKAKSIPMEDTVAEAQSRGLNGEETSAFDRGARGEEQKKFGSIAEWSAYLDGAKWGKDQSATDLHPGATDAQTKEVQGSLRDTRVTDDQREQQKLNQAIDSVYGSTIKPAEQAQLKRMVKEGASGHEIDEAARYFATGHGALVQEQPTAKPFKGEVVTPSQYTRMRRAREAAARQTEAETQLGQQDRAATDQELIQRHQRRGLIVAAAERMREQREAEQAREQETSGKELHGDIRDLNRYKRGGNGVYSARADTIREHVEALTKDWKSGHQVHVVDSLDQLPADIRESIKADGAHEAYGFSRNGETYLLAHNIPNVETASAALFHEALGHNGLDSLFREKMGSALEQMYRGNASLRKEVDAWREKNAGYYRKDDLALAVEEVLARRSEGGQIEASRLSKIAAVIKQFARRMGIKLNFSDKEVNAILSMAHDHIINGSPESATSKGTKYMMALWHGSPHDFDRFSLDKIGTGEGAQVYGHGLYFASMKDVAEQYRDSLAGYSGAKIPSEEVRAWVAENTPAALKGSDLLPSIQRQITYMGASHGMWRDLRQEYDRDWMDARREGNKKDEVVYRAAIDMLDHMNDWAKSKASSGKIYNVNVKPTDAQFMDWFKPLSEQSQHVKDALAKLGFEVRPEDKNQIEPLKGEVHELAKKVFDASQEFARASVDGEPSDVVRAAQAKWQAATEELDTAKQALGRYQQKDLAGADIYNQLRRRLESEGAPRFPRNGEPGSAELASKALLDAGIRGNKYEDQFSRGKNEGTHNYVVFDDSDIEIANKYMRPAQINEKVGDAVKDAIGKTEELVKSADPLGKSRKVLLYYGGENTVARKLGAFFNLGDRNGLLDHIKANDQRPALANMFARTTNKVFDQARGLKRTDPKSHAALNELVMLTANGINPGRDWGGQSEFVKANPDNKPALDRATTLLRSLQAKDAAAKSSTRVDLYSDLRAHEDASMLRQFSNQIHKMVTANKLSSGQVIGFEMHPADEMMEQSTQRTFTVQETKQFWENKVDNQLNALEGFVKNQRQIADHPGTPDDAKREITHNIADLEALHKQMKEGVAKLNMGPNFHLGRSGDYYVDMRLRTDDEGNVDKAALLKAQEHLKEFGVVVPLNASADHIYMRVENPSAWNDLHLKAQQLQKMGVVRKDDQEGTAIHAGKRGDDHISRAAAPWLPKYEAAINARTDISTDTKAALVKELRQTSLDAMSDSAIAKYLAPRDYIAGFSGDMFDSFLTRAQAANNSMVGQVVAPKIADAYGKMEEALEVAGKADAKDVPLEQRAAMTDTISEWRKRDDNRVSYEQTPAVDAMRRATNFFALGGTVAYPIVQLTQLPMVALPKLGAKHGFVKAAMAIGSVTAESLRIMKAVFKTGTDVEGLSAIQKGARAANVEVSLEALHKAGVTGRKAEYLMRLVNANQLGTGSQAHVLSAASDGSVDGGFNHTMQLASGMGYYAETLTRVITALAHLKLNPEGSAADAAPGGIQLLKDSLFDFHLDAQGRAFGKHGMFGTKTPLMTQFMTYQSQLVQQLYLGIGDAWKGDKEAQKFLLQHAAMTTMLAGTLGLPFATAFAAAYNQIKEKLDPEDGPSDVLSSYRGYLTDMFGKDVGEIIAKGGFRGLGVDMTSRIGEQDILPFSKFLADRRALKDQFKDLESRSWGAPANMAANALQGAQRLGDGDVIGGLTTMMPAVLANPIKAYRMTQDGYVDASGKQLPITKPEDTAVLAQLLGFTPAAKTDYSDKNMALKQRAGVLTRQANGLKGQLLDALQSKDSDTAHSLIIQAQQFEKDNPGYPVLSKLQQTLQARSKQQAISQATGLPLGTNIKDVGARQLVNY